MEEKRQAPKRARVSSGRVYSSSDSKSYHSDRRSFGEGSDRRGRSFGDNSDRPRRSFGEGSDRRGRSFGEGSERPRRSFGDNSDRPRRSFGEGSERPRRSFGDSSDRPRRSFGDNTDRPRRSFGEGSERPRRSFSDNSDRPRRSFSDNTDRPRRNFSEGEERPRRSFGEFSDRPRRSFGDNSDRPRRSFGDRKPSFGGKASGGSFKKGGFKKREDNSGINRMISRRPLVDKLQNSDFDSAPTNFQEEIRLNKFIANSGVCSRREADELIQAGVVTVNGEVVTELGVKVNVLKDEIRFNGEKLKGEEKVYIVMNKPRGYVTTASDPNADKTVMDLLKDCKVRVFPVGRLDKNTTGVLMFTNDGEIAEKLTHPSYDKKKIYQVSLDRPLSQEDFGKIIEGVTLGDGEIKADELEFIDSEDHRKLGIEIHSGKNRIVRRIFESLGYDVKALERVYFAGLTKKGLKRGEWRFLTQGESNVLKMGAYL